MDRQARRAATKAESDRLCSLAGLEPLAHEMGDHIRVLEQEITELATFVFGGKTAQLAEAVMSYFCGKLVERLGGQVDIDIPKNWRDDDDVKVCTVDAIPGGARLTVRQSQ